MSENSLTIQPIGVVHSNKQVKFLAPYQPENTVTETNTIELFPKKIPREALHDLSGFSRIWLIWWFHKNTTWRSKVLPPRGRGGRRGLFSTRSPHRPNPLGITAVPLIKVDGYTLTIGACDLVEGTPIFDIKPYVPSYDAFTEEKIGWLEEIEKFDKSAPQYTVTYSALALDQISWLKNKWNIDFQDTVRSILSKDPLPHRTRRIYRGKKGGFCLYAGAWTVYYNITEFVVTVDYISNGFAVEVLMKKSYEDAPDRLAQLDFVETYKPPATQV